eukprot:TRINITY_DN7232_c0_g2_i7.p2 TRINITY_DN7232_c0_g2~~TRINITY_DN7232_c0_g2_i7.p2  ORF type:complete len:207 (+),score=-8.56 TRINITY_DN7232_c0_g2_i7:23-643(+)
MFTVYCPLKHEVNRDKHRFINISTAINTTQQQQTAMQLHKFFLHLFSYYVISAIKQTFFPTTEVGQIIMVANIQMVCYHHSYNSKNYQQFKCVNIQRKLFRCYFSKFLPLFRNGRLLSNYQTNSKSYDYQNQQQQSSAIRNPVITKFRIQQTFFLGPNISFKNRPEIKKQLIYNEVVQTNRLVPHQQQQKYQPQIFTANLELQSKL